jgi:hypothetical protein
MIVIILYLRKFLCRLLAFLSNILPIDMNRIISKFINNIRVVNKVLKLFSLLLFLNILFVYPSYCQDKTNLHENISSDIVIKFKIPKGWDKIKENLFVLKDYNKELNNWAPYLKQGHMPWRYDPKNIAVTCLWSFGITDGSSVDDFAQRLTEIKKDKVYSLDVDSTEYVIYVRTKKHTPIAYKFEVK